MPLWKGYVSDFENRAGVLDRNLLDLKVMASSELAMNFGCERVRKWLHAHEAMLTRGGVYNKPEFFVHRTNWRAASNSLSSGTQSFPVPGRRPGRLAMRALRRDARRGGGMPSDFLNQPPMPLDQGGRPHPASGV